MGSATTQARARVGAVLGDASGIDLTVARELFQAARLLGSTPALAGALADPAAAPAARSQVVSDVFGRVFSANAVQLLTSAATVRWSSEEDFVEGVEELAIRAAAVAEPDVDLEGELFAFARTVAENPELELALGSRFGNASAKGALIEKLLGGRASASTVLVVSSIAQQSADRRIRQALSWAMGLAAAQRGRVVASVVSATALTPAQAERLRQALAAKYGTEISLNTVIDPTIVGGLRVQIADDVIDASISAKLADLRQRLAG
ncbi:F0F1 ATP synthase subunit delta [Microbacterium sp. CIAB417]|uniref:F0F1 ATP synthase subunit delta n=1 Tax=Microbacterium sp. CIAB417 TaxID=2860287 RepID=UPI001FAD332A|nr:F0F1 ATP synthase subunit delta [Microbacterium sp. CIAB417]